MYERAAPFWFWTTLWQVRRTRNALYQLAALLLLATTAHWWAHEPNGTWLPPLIPYTAHTLDQNAVPAVSPFQVQNGVDLWHRHWLGTDDYGRDVAAGLLEGLQHALEVGIGGMLLALLLGLTIGMVAGYYGDQRLRVTRLARLRGRWTLGIGLAFSAMQNAPFWWLKCGLILLLCHFFFLGIEKIYVVVVSKKATPSPTWWQQYRPIPIDFWLLRGIETLTALPTLLVFLAILSLLPRIGILDLVLLLGSVAWLGVARVVRGEMLQLRQSGFIEAAEVMGVPTRQILLRHALPNVLPTAMVGFTLGVAQLILVEAAISFLGVGLPPEVVTLGTMLSLARYHFAAWWLAVFPGALIFWLLRLLQRLAAV